MKSPGSAAAAAAADCASFINESFERYNAEFREITRRAPARFDQRDWHGAQRDAVERIELYDRTVDGTIATLRLRLGSQVRDHGLWARIREQFSAEISAIPDNEFRKTFFSSVTRRLFGTVGVAPDIEFVAKHLDPLASITTTVVTSVYQNRGSLNLLIEDLLSDINFHSPWRDFERSVAHMCEEIATHVGAIGERRTVSAIEVIKPVFYQYTRAYVVGRVSGRGFARPLVLALKNTESGILVDTVMLDEDDISVLFSFTRSYFHVDLERVGEAVVFLKSLLPRKAIGELFTVLGRAKQGKTERFRSLLHHLDISSDSFVHAPGERGLVMVCFTLPSYDAVFKIIRDRFAYPKNVLREEVIAKYQFVFKHDRAGRLVDAQEFKRMRFPLNRIDAQLLQELLSEAANTVHIERDDLVIDHLYIERRMTPLNLFLRQASDDDADRAVLDYGQCIRDLAATNIFAGDLLLKNFGVTRLKRVIFYDYDELCRVTDCSFRDIPQAAHPEDEMLAESWFYVGDNDVFPETFINFLAFTDAQKDLFLRVHGEILTAAFWRGIQQRINAGEALDVVPYNAHRVRVASSI
ncbi:MAG: bifunctional isocitrate dehydrogenase kinase/phosphatase [Steroidobacteraceae bacterium]